MKLYSISWFVCNQMLRTTELKEINSHWRSLLPWRPRECRWRRRWGWRREFGRRSNRILEFLLNHFSDIWRKVRVFRNPIWHRIRTGLENGRRHRNVENISSPRMKRERWRASTWGWRPRRWWTWRRWTSARPSSTRNHFETMMISLRPRRPSNVVVGEKMLTHS